MNAPPGVPDFESFVAWQESLAPRPLFLVASPPRTDAECLAEFDRFCLQHLRLTLAQLEAHKASPGWPTTRDQVLARCRS